MLAGGDRQPRLHFVTQRRTKPEELVGVSGEGAAVLEGRQNRCPKGLLQVQLENNMVAELRCRLCTFKP